MMNRRRFLKILRLLFTSAFLSTCNPSVAKSGKQRILIVGAGAAGLAAAKFLSERGCDAIVLEARKRIGGRVWTSVKWADAPMDLGASWIHGIVGNPIADLAEKAGARTVITSYDHSIIYNANGRPLDALQVKRIERLSEKIARLARRAQNDDRDRSLQSTVEIGLQWETLAPEEKQFASFVLNGEYEQEYAGSAAELSTYWFDDGSAFGGEDVLFPDGYGALADYLARGIQIETDRPVRSIRWDSDGVVVATDRETFAGDRAIATLPLGVLKANAVTFTPRLPERKVEAIAALGKGVLNKCYLRLPQVFWPSEFDWIERMLPRKVNILAAVPTLSKAGWGRIAGGQKNGVRQFL